MGLDSSGLPGSSEILNRFLTDGGSGNDILIGSETSGRRRERSTLSAAAA